MPEPKDTKNSSWFIKGSTDDEMVKSFGKDRVGFSKGNDVLLHRMFEKFLDECEEIKGQGEGNDDFGTGTQLDQTALIEYLEGEKVENMKTISYRELNKQANRLARILIRKLGMIFFEFDTRLI